MKSSRESSSGLLTFANLVKKNKADQPVVSTRGGELGVLGVREHPLNMEVHPLTVKSTPSKGKENLMKHHFKQISNKVMVVLTFILGLYLCKTAVIYYSALN